MVFKKNDCIRLLITCMVLLKAISTKAQDDRLQYPLILQKAYFGIDIGAISYPFSNAHLASGYSAETISNPREGVRITLFGYHFTPGLSARITYMRPVDWVDYKNINGDGRKHTVWMNIGGLSVRQVIPLFPKFSLTAEAGLAVITRHGFKIGRMPVVADASYATVGLGAALEYQLNSKWDLNVYASYSPGRAALKQPSTSFIAGGFNYNMHALTKTPSTEERNSKAFPKQTVQFAATTNMFGYAVNHFFGEGKVPVFWGGNVAVESGVAINYRRNIFHTRKTFSLDLGGSIGSWESNQLEESFFAISLYPVMRFNFLRLDLADLYFLYSVAGPCYISRAILDGYDTGKHFTFRDYMGIGGYFGRHGMLNGEISIVIFQMETYSPIMQV